MFKPLKNIKCKSRKCRITASLLLVLLLLSAFCLPEELFKEPASTILYDKNGRLLGARIAADGQWRFPGVNTVPYKFEKALLAFEDEYFYWHIGVNPVSAGRALVQNIKSGKVVSGGSTITMQVIRISQKGKQRTYLRKLWEMVLALRLEIRYSKKKILALYASHAPFGGNVVGLEAASWRFFGRAAKDLSWAEAAALAVLPNAPSLIYPGKNSKRLKAKRDRLLDKLLRLKVIDKTTCSLAKMESIPSKIHRLPHIAPHLLDRVSREHKGERVVSTIDYQLQKHVNAIAAKHQKRMEAVHVHNMAVLVMNTQTREVLAYVGNTEPKKGEQHGNQVDIITALRSTGSLLKPFLFAGRLNAGEMLSTTLIPDIPTQTAGYSPKNFNLKYDGAVPAGDALARSLNVPAVRMLKDYGVERFHYLLKKMGMKSLNRAASHYGLSLILGGAEGSLWNICGMYAGMAGILMHYNQNDGVYFGNEIQQPVYTAGNLKWKNPGAQPLLSAAAVYKTFNALLEVHRPDGERGWRSFNSPHKIAWKTGTSFGFRDAWAIGVTPNFTVGVWAGNADGEGRPGLTGVGAAAPVMFDVFDILPRGKWFLSPDDEMVKVPICRQSGYRAGRWCNITDSLMIPETGLQTAVCPYHRLIHLDKSRRFRVSSDCESVQNMVHQSWFVLPPAMEWYYKKRNPLYRTLPPFRSGCRDAVSIPAMELIYPKENTRIFIPVELDGKRGKTVFEIAHHNPDAEVCWHIDNEFIGITKGVHQMELNPGAGKHIITWVDKQANILEKVFTVVGKSDKEVK